MMSQFLLPPEPKCDYRVIHNPVLSGAGYGVMTGRTLHLGVEYFRVIADCGDDWRRMALMQLMTWLPIVMYPELVAAGYVQLEQQHVLMGGKNVVKIFSAKRAA